MEENNNKVVVTNPCPRKARKKRRKLLGQELFLDYANNTTLHGLPYMTKKGVTLFEKVFWLIIFIISVSWCVYLISNVWYKWRHSPVIVTVSEQPVSVTAVPFPSVTICPQLKCKLSKYNYTDNKSKYSATELLYEYIMANDKLNETKEVNRYFDVSQICATTLEKKRFATTFSLIYPFYKDNQSSVFEHIHEVAPNITDVFYLCSLHGEPVPCSDHFQEVVTEEGICYTINSLAADTIFRLDNLQKNYSYLNTTKHTQGWSVETGYQELPPNKSSDYYYPFPGTENAVSPDVEVILKDYLNEHDENCNSINTGFKVYIQHPADYPQSSVFYYAVLNGQVSSMALSFNSLSTSETLEKYDAEVRKCYFPHERHLKYFKIYTANNCRIECLSNIIYEKCHCVPFYMPHNSSENICKIGDNICIQTALASRFRSDGIKCNCLPSCNSVDYVADMTKTDYNFKKLLNSFDLEYEGDITVETNERIQYSKLEIYYRRPDFMSMRRSELFGVTDFIANCGGLLGLFLGFSFLSLVEIIYFLTIRLYLTLKKDWQPLWSSGLSVGLLIMRWWVRSPQNTNIYLMKINICVWSGCFLYIISIYLQKKSI